MDRYYIILIAVAIFVGTGIATLTIGIILQNRNRLGDSKGSYKNYANASLHVLRNEKKF